MRRPHSDAQDRSAWKAESDMARTYPMLESVIMVIAPSALYHKYQAGSLAVFMEHTPAFKALGLQYTAAKLVCCRA